MVKFNRLKDQVVSNKAVIVRVDLNVPIIDSKIVDDTRIKSIIPTLKYLAKNNAKVIVISHFGRPEGKFVEAMSLGQIVEHLQFLLGDIKLNFVRDSIGLEVKNAVEKTNYGEIILLENLRFHKAETQNDPEFSRQLASLANLYVNDAFSCSHRSHSSITGITEILKSCAGFLMEVELDNLSNLILNAKKPMMAVVGGAKVSTKIDLLKSLVLKANTIVVGGGMANSFLYAQGFEVGKSLCEKDLRDTALEILDLAKVNNCKIILPKDVIVAKNFKANDPSKNLDIKDVKPDDLILDLGKESSKYLTQILQEHKTVLWNGPLGAFELEPFNLGTITFANDIANLTKQGKLLSIAGGGDVVSAINSCNLFDQFTYISTAGGAFLEWLEGKNLPGILSLEKSAKHQINSLNQN